MSERVLEFGAETPLAGVFNKAGEGSRPPVLLFNAGVVHRIGAHRLNVKIARDLAAAGVASLRFDLAGLGDSPPAPPGRGWEEQAIADISAAMDALEAETGADRFLAIGMCSGADHSYRAALADVRLAGIALLDPYAYANRAAARADFVARATSTARWSRKMRSLFEKEDETEGETISAVPGGDEQDQARPIPPREEFGADLERLTRRGVRILIVYTGFVRAFASRPEHFFQTFSDFDFDEQLDVVTLPETDHTYTQLAAQEKLLSHLRGWISAHFAPAEARGS